MITIALCLSLISIYCLYAISKRVEIEKKGIMRFLDNRRALAMFLSGSTLLISTLILVNQFGLGVGIFTSLSLWMVLASLTTLILPFNVIKWPYLALGILIVIGIEMSVHLA